MPKTEMQQLIKDQRKPIHSGNTTQLGMAGQQANSHGIFTSDEQKLDIKAALK